MNTNQLLLCLSLCSLTHPLLADTYKCMQGGRPIYQAAPCEVNSDKGKLDIKTDTPEQKALAKEKLEAIKSEYDAEKTAETQAENEAKPQNTQQPSAPPSPPVRSMYTYGNPRNDPANPDAPLQADQPVKIIYPWGNPKYQPTE